MAGTAESREYRFQPAAPGDPGERPDMHMNLQRE